MIGRTVSAVTLGSGALSENYLKVRLTRSREANRIVDVKIAGLTDQGVSEVGDFPILSA
jgi:hypothetical protein